MTDTFALQLKAFAEKAKDHANVVVRNVSIDLLTATVMRTPVGNPSLWQSPAPKGYVGGRLRANWNVSLGAPDDSTTTATDAGGSGTISRGSSVINEYKAQDIYITNSLPYAIPVEYGHSAKQSPAGMVRVSVAESQAFVSKAIASLK
jgi:hypothetical protein